MWICCHIPLPQGQALTQGVHIHITRGTLTSTGSECGWRLRWSRCPSPALCALPRCCGTVCRACSTHPPRIVLHRCCAQLLGGLAQPEVAADSPASTPPGIAPLPTAVPNYWEDLRGTCATPIVIEAADGKGSVIMDNMNLKDVR